MFEAIAEVTGIDRKSSAGHIAKVRHALARAEPPYTPDEVREFGRRLWQFCPWARESQRQRPTLGEVEKYIGLLRSAEAPKPAATKYWTPPIFPDRQEETGHAG